MANPTSRLQGDSALDTGSEKIYLKVERKSLKTKDNDRFELNLYIAEVLNHSRGKPGVATYVFRCVSSHAYINQTMTLDTAFKGTIGTQWTILLLSDCW